MSEVDALFDDGEKSPSSCNIGLGAEVAFASKAISMGFTVFMPFGHSQKADLVIWKPPSRAITVQVKKATYQKDGGNFKFMIGSGKPSCASNPLDYGLRYTPYQRGDFDVMAVYMAERQSFVIYKLEDIVGKSSMRWTAGRNSENNWDVLDIISNM